jgi:hypothetical protein
MINFFRWANLVLGVFAAGVGVFVLRGVFHNRLSRASAVRFLRFSLLASLAGLMPLARHITPVQSICMASVYCSAAAIVAWFKFGLLGRSRRVFAIAVTAVLYFDCVFVFTWLFGNPPLFTVRLAQPLAFLQYLQILFAASFLVLGALAAKMCPLDSARVPRIGTFTHRF